MALMTFLQATYNIYTDGVRVIEIQAVKDLFVQYMNPANRRTQCYTLAMNRWGLNDGTSVLCVVLKCLCVKIALHPSLFLPSGTSQGHFLTAQYHYHTLDWSLAVTLCSLPFVIFKSTNSIFLKIVHFLFNLYFSWKRKRGWKQKKKAKILYQYFVTLCVLFVYLTKKNIIIIIHS